MAIMRQTPHPGEIIKELCLEPLGISVTKAADLLGVSRKTLSELVNGKSSISTEMAFRLSKAFGGSVESWLTQQMHYDISKAKHLEKKIKVKKIS